PSHWPPGPRCRSATARASGRASCGREPCRRPRRPGRTCREVTPRRLCPPGCKPYESNVRSRSSTETRRGEGSRGGSAGAAATGEAGTSTGGGAVVVVVVVVDGGAAGFTAATAGLGAGGLAVVVVVGLGCGGVIGVAGTV